MPLPRALRLRSLARRAIVAALVPVVPVASLTPGEIETAMPPMIVSTTPTAILCDGAAAHATRLDDGIFVIDVAALGCASVDPAVGAGAPAAASSASSLMWAGASFGSSVRKDDRPKLVVERVGATWRVSVNGVAEPPRVLVDGRVLSTAFVRSTGMVARELPRRPGDDGLYRGTASAVKGDRHLTVVGRSAAFGEVAAQVELPAGRAGDS
jgi:hypothetical protein